jgi:hypothetical protein
MPDRPGALGRVAGAIGSVGASLIAIDILEQEAGWAIDELVVDAVDSPNAAQKLLVALQFVEGVQVEDLRPSPPVLVDPRVGALQTAVDLVESEKRGALIDVLVQRAHVDLAADWVVLVDFERDEPLATVGKTPETNWLHAFLSGSRSMRQLGESLQGPEDILWSELIQSELALVLGRDGRPFRHRERQQLDALVRIADLRYADLPE